MPSARATDFVHIINSVRLLYLIRSFNFCLKDMTASNAQRIHEQRSNSARYSSNRVTALQQKQTRLTRCVYTVRLHARCTFTRSVARAYRTSGGRVISVLRSFFSPPSRRSTIVFFKRNVNFLLTATVIHFLINGVIKTGVKIITIRHSNI